jgi:hypothetical protein
MSVFAQVLLELVSMVLCIILLRYMVKPYLSIGDARYVGLPFGFAFLGASYFFMAVAFYLSPSHFAEEIKWTGLLLEIYAFVFLAMTYYVSGRLFKRSTRLAWQLLFSGLILAMIISFLIVFVPPTLTLPTYKDADRYMSVLEIILASYLVFYTLRSHIARPDPKTIWAPIGYIMLAFAEYSSLIWSLDSSFSAFIGNYLIRIGGLLVFVYVSYRVFAEPTNAVIKDRGS